MRLRDRLVDLCLVALFPLALPFLFLAGRKRWRLRLARRIQDWLGVTVIRNHYYEPVFTDRDLDAVQHEVRTLPGIDLNLPGQIATLQRFNFSDELATLDGAVIGDQIYRYANQNHMFAEGDADALYSFIRAFKPQTVIEIGCGQSSLVVQAALRKNASEQPHYNSRHICIEPFHNGWLKGIGARFEPRSVLAIDLELFRNLKANDIVFIDSTHVLRARGDVEHEFLRILPLLPVGVLVQIHDVFTPRDYIVDFLRNDRRFWTEQYVLEAFLTLNPHYEVLLALNDMHKRREPNLYRAFPVLESMPDLEPGSFWIRRRL